jgi:large subunit ribosomal protein L30
MVKLCVIRIRSDIGASKAQKRMLEILGLKRTNSCVIVDEKESILGMLRSLEHYITYGKINENAIKSLLAKRAMISNKKKYEWKEGELDAFVKDFLAGKATLKDKGIKHVFYLHPPAGGYEKEGIKKLYRERGALGDRGENINDLLLRMI